MKNIKANVLPFLAAAGILSPIPVSLVRREPPPPPAPVVQAPEPRLVVPETDPDAWFATIRPHCTPAEVTLATDLNRPPEGVEGLGYKAACFALARQVPKARALLLSLPDDDRVRGAALVYDVAQRLAAEGRHDTAGPMMELVLEFWPNHYLALYEAGTARYTTGDLTGAQEYLGRFLEVYVGDEDLVANAHRMMGSMAER